MDDSFMKRQSAADSHPKQRPQPPARPAAPSAERRDRQSQLGGHNQNAERQVRQQHPRTSGNRHS